MKNNKKVYLLTALAFLVCNQEISAMASARKAVKHLGVGLFRANAFEYKKLHSLVKPNLIGAAKTVSINPFVQARSFCESNHVAPEISVTAPIEEVLTKLLEQKDSPESFARINDVIRMFIGNQQLIQKRFKELIESHMGGTVVERFDIPEKNMKEIVRKLSCFSVEPVFYRSLDKDPIPQLSVVKAFQAIGFSMNKAAERAFLNTHKKTADTVNFNCDQMQVAVDHECLHIQNGDGDLKVLFTFLSQSRKSFSDEEFYTIMGAFGEQFLRYRPSLIAAITKEAKEMGIHDFSKIENFDRDLTAFERYSEVRVDEMILASKDEKKIQAYRDYYKARNDSQPIKDRAASDKANVIFCLTQGRTIPLEVADFLHPTDQERVDACDKALAELKAAKK